MTPGALHHIIAQGTQRIRIFRDDADRVNSSTRRSGLFLPGVSQSVKRGEELVNARGYRFFEAMKLQK
ncbi:MAG: hypothetical protein AMJ94_19215 [Deltaproteobacteria bacterium SM23_61]|nr:MAG: hypothetical protein AMJ94_19215 [Deltaproteobacteria bacterium SM23_61]